MKYRKEIDELLHELFYEDWMTEEEYNELTSEIFKHGGISKTELCNNIDTGVLNGISVETQLKLVRSMFKYF